MSISKFSSICVCMYMYNVCMGGFALKSTGLHASCNAAKSESLKCIGYCVSMQKSGHQFNSATSFLVLYLSCAQPPWAGGINKELRCHETIKLNNHIDIVCFCNIYFALLFMSKSFCQINFTLYFSTHN